MFFVYFTAIAAVASPLKVPRTKVRGSIPYSRLGTQRLSFNGLRKMVDRPHKACAQVKRSISNTEIEDNKGIIVPSPEMVGNERETYLITLGVRSYTEYDKALGVGDDVRRKQKAYIRDKMAEGDIIAFGPFRGLIFPPTNSQDVGLWAVKAVSVDEAREIFLSSPYYEAGIVPGFKIVKVIGQKFRAGTTENEESLDSIREQIKEVRRDVEASKRVHKLLQTEMEAAHSELKNARDLYEQYNREVNLQRFDWLSSGSLETLRQLKPIYEGLEKLQANSKARTKGELEIEEMYQTIARDFINIYEQEMDGAVHEDQRNNPIAKWVTKVFGASKSTDGGAEKKI